MWIFTSGIVCGIIFGGCTLIVPDGKINHGVHPTKKECEIKVRENMLQVIQDVPSSEDVIILIECGIQKNMV